MALDGPPLSASAPLETMLRSKRTFAVSLSLALGVLGVAAVQSFGLFESPPAEEPLVNSAAGRRKPKPTSGGSAPTKGGTVDEVGVPSALIPSDTAVYVEIESFQVIERVVRDLVGKIDPTAAVMFEPEQMLQGMLGAFGAKIADVDRKRPLGLALSISGAGDPRPTLVLPVLAPQEFQRGLQLAPGLAAPRTAARYVGLSLGPDYPIQSSNPIKSGFEPATLNARIELAPFRDQISQGLAQARRLGGSASGDAAYEWGQQVGYSFIESLENVDVSLDLDGDEVVLHMGLALDPASSFVRPLPEEPVDLEALLSFASSGDDLIAVVGWDRPFLDEVVVPFFDRVGSLARSEEDERSLDQLQAALAFLPTLGEQAGIFGSVEVGAAHLTVVCRPSDADTLLGMTSMALAGVDREGLPFGLGTLQKVQVEDGRAARLTIDLATSPADHSRVDARVREMLAILFGSEQIELQVTSRGGWFLITLGAAGAWRDDVVAHTATDAGGRQALPELAELVARGQGASPVAAYRVDLVALQRNLMTLMADQMNLDATAEVERLESALGSDRLYLSGYGAVLGERWVTGTRLDFGRWLTLLEMMR